MQEIFKKIIERLEGRRGIAARDKYESKSSDDRSYYQGADYGYYKAIEIVNQVADIYGSEELYDRNKIYDYIKTQINPYGKPFQGSVKEFGYKVMDYIKNMPDGTDINVGSNDGWIPCSERLPEIRDRYLCQIERTSYSYMDLLYFSKNLEEVDEYDFMGKKCAGFYSYDSEYGHCEYDGVIAWQPLPEPYKPKGE